MGWNSFHQTDIQSFFSKQDACNSHNSNRAGPTCSCCKRDHHRRQVFSLVESLHRRQQQQQQRDRSSVTPFFAHHVTKPQRLLDFVQEQPQRYVSSIEFDAQDAIFALAYSERNIEIHEFLPFLLQQNGRNGGGDTTTAKKANPTYSADTLRLRLDTQQRKHSVSKFSPVNNNVLACGFRNCHATWLFDLERCSETEPTQVLGKNENLAVGCQNLCFGSPTTSHHHPQQYHAACLACACNDGLGRIYDIRSRHVSSACLLLRRQQAAQQHLASAILLEDHFVYMGYASGEVAQFDLRMTESSYASPLHLWNPENLLCKEKIGSQPWKKSCSAVDDILQDPFFPSVIITRNRDGVVMGIDTHRMEMAFCLANPTGKNTERSAPKTDRTKRQRIYGIDETVFSQETFFSQNMIDLPEEERLLSLASRLKKVHRLQCSPCWERTNANIIFPDPFSSNLRRIDIIASLKKYTKTSAQQIPFKANSLPCAVALHKPTNHLLVGLMNGKTVVIEL